MKSTTKQEKQFPHRQYQSHKIISVIIAIVLFVTLFSGCDNNTVISTVVDDTQPDKNNHTYMIGSTLNTGYSEEDSLNPFFISTDLNSEIVSLVFEPLFYIDDSFCARNALASSYSMNELTLTVKLDTSAAFSDGVQFSSADVVYSFNLAKESENYKNELSCIVSAAARANDAVVFELTTKNANAVDSLSFPVVKTGTADTADAKPLGTGLYKINTAGENISLEYNPYCRKPQPKITTVKLTKIPDSATLLHTLELGTIDAYFDDMSSGSYSQANAQTSKTNLSNLVFLGMKSSSYGLSSTALRQAIFYSINRQSIVRNSFKNYAVESAVPYHPEWHAISDAQFELSDLTLNYSKARELMQNAGFRDKLNYSLIVYSGNNFKIAAAKEIQNNLKNIGIELTIRELTWDNYKLALINGDYDFYIGEIKLPKNMDMSSLFGSGSAVYGVSPSDTTAAAYSEFINGNISLDSFTLSFVQNMPFVPICFRMGALVYSNNISPAADCDMNNAYKNIYEWEIKK